MHEYGLITCDATELEQSLHPGITVSSGAASKV